MTSCQCNNKLYVVKKTCPLCKEEGKNLHHLVVKEVVKKDLKYLVQNDKYFICRNDKCEAVFYNEEKDTMFLNIDINMAADFNEVCKTDGGGCHKGCNSCH
ncbi:MAG: hypothetical protein JJT76_09780 [Clostridiaceae bacterium]|nr:hypothetical protein [Clostridiaceae bacterium]